MSKLKRLAAPKFWPIEVKTKKYVVKPKPGPHSLDSCIPLGIVVRDILKHAETMKEAKQILNKGILKVDGRVRKDHRFPVGLMDVVEVGNDFYRILSGTHGLYLNRIEKKDANKLARIENKVSLKGGRTQLNLHDGNNIILSKDDYSTGDVLVLDGKKIKQVLRFDKNSHAVIIKGRNMGRSVVIKKIVITKSPQPNIVVVDMDGTEVPVPKDYVFVMGEVE